VSRVLLIDESVNKKLASELRARGLESWSAEELKVAGRKDQVVLRHLAALDYAWVLVTGDDAMPTEHKAIIRDTQATIATIDGEWEHICKQRGLVRSQEQFKRDTVHRWAHVMIEQEQGEIRRYSPGGGYEWVPRRR
jgi:hypothetical protein